MRGVRNVRNVKIMSASDGLLAFSLLHVVELTYSGVARQKVFQRRIKRCWSFSNLATMCRIMLMYYVNCSTFFEQPEKDWLKILEMDYPPPDEKTLFD